MSIFEYGSFTNVPWGPTATTPPPTPYPKPPIPVPLPTSADVDMAAVELMHPWCRAHKRVIDDLPKKAPLVYLVPSDAAAAMQQAIHTGMAVMRPDQIAQIQTIPGVGNAVKKR